MRNRMHSTISSLALIICVALAAPVHGETGPNLLANPGFEEGLASWQGEPSANGVAAAATVDGRTVAHVAVPSEDPVAWPMIRQRIAMTPGQILECSAQARAVNARDGYGAYIAFNFYRASGERITFAQSPGLLGDTDWETLLFRGVAPDETASMDVSVLLNGHGDAYFDDVSLVKLGEVDTTPPDGPVVLTVGDVVVDSLVGFGFEDDAWIYNEENASHGVTEADWPVRENRIEWMDPDFVRMFFWYHDWNPSHDWETFTFDSDNMQSHYRALDLYERLGTRVDITGVEWGMSNAFGNLPAVARAIGALVEHLVKTKGYSCAQYWTLTNEPNLGFHYQGTDFDDFVELHQLVRAEFNQRGLNMKIVGSDDAQNADWFRDCVTNPGYHATVDLYASHRYFPAGSQPMIPFFYADRLPLLAEQTPVRPFIVGEFGFQDSRASGPLYNPVMEDYPYAVWATDFCIQGLNRGAAGMSIWCLHEMYYPGNGFMNYGLWNYKDRGWGVRPVYHAIANFTRLTEAGETVRKVESTHPGFGKAAVVGDTLFWVNPGSEAVELRLVGFQAKEVRVHTEASLLGERETGYTVPLNAEGGFSAPAMSFGYAEGGLHSADTDADAHIDTAELLRVIQLYQSGAHHCAAGTVDGYAPGAGPVDCPAHDSDYRGGPDWRIELSELLRSVQLARVDGYAACGSSEDGFCLGGI